MSKRVFFYVNYNNIVVLKMYLDVIKASFEKEGFECSYVKTLLEINKNDILVVPMGTDACKFYFKGYRNIVLWQQGVTAEESYLRHKSSVRRFILNSIDSFIMKKSKMIFYVSNELRRYYERIGKCSYQDKSYIMPCFNETFDPDVFTDKDYSKKVFSYVGSIDLWQCFEETVELYSRIEKSFHGTFFKVLTFKVDEAEKIINKHGVARYSVKCVPKEEVNDELKDVSYGFIIRDDIVVNRVATPTKFSSYLAAGVLPIFSSCLKDFYDSYGNSDIVCVADNYSDITEFVGKEHDKGKVMAEIKNIFNSYYSVEYHERRIRERIKELIL